MGVMLLISELTKQSNPTVAVVYRGSLWSDLHRVKRKFLANESSNTRTLWYLFNFRGVYLFRKPNFQLSHILA